MNCEAQLDLKGKVKEDSEKIDQVCSDSKLTELQKCMEKRKVGRKNLFC